MNGQEYDDHVSNLFYSRLNAVIYKTRLLRLLSAYEPPKPVLPWNGTSHPVTDEIHISARRIDEDSIPGYRPADHE